MKNWLTQVSALYKKEFITRMIDFKGVSNRVEFAVVWLTVTLIWFVAVKTSGMFYYKHTPTLLFMLQGVMSLPVLSTVTRRARSLLPNPTSSVLKMWVWPAVAVILTILPLIGYLMLLIFFFIPVNKHNQAETTADITAEPTLVVKDAL